eukprot:gene1516-2916_t
MSHNNLLDANGKMRQTKTVNNCGRFNQADKKSTQCSFWPILMASESDLPYFGDLQEAIRRQDREAVKQLLRNDRLLSTSTHKNSGFDISCDFVRSSFLSLGYSQDIISNTFPDDSNDNAPNCIKRLLNSYSKFPIPKKKKGPMKDSVERVTPELITRLDSKSICTLLQACVDHPSTPQILICNLLIKLQFLCRSGLLSDNASHWIESGIREGYFEEINCIISHLECLIEAKDSQTNGLQTLTNDDAVGFPNELNSSHSYQEQLLPSYQCPITREILVEPVTLQCGHNYSRMALDSLLLSGNRRCPVCKASIGAGELAVNVVLRDTIELLFPHVLRRRAVDDIQAARRAGIKELRSVMRWLDNYPHAAEIVQSALDVVSEWVIMNQENKDKIVKEGFVKTICKLSDCPAALQNMLTSELYFYLLQGVMTVTFDDDDDDYSHVAAPALASASTIYTNRTVGLTQTSRLILQMAKGMSRDQLSSLLSDSVRGLPALIAHTCSHAVRLCLGVVNVSLDGVIAADGETVSMSLNQSSISIVETILSTGFLDFVIEIFSIDGHSCVNEALVLLSRLCILSSPPQRNEIRSHCSSHCLNFLTEHPGVLSARDYSLTTSACAAVAGMFFYRDCALLDSSIDTPEIQSAVEVLGSPRLGTLVDHLEQSAVSVSNRSHPPDVKWLSAQGFQLSTTTDDTLHMQCSTAVHISSQGYAAFSYPRFGCASIDSVDGAGTEAQSQSVPLCTTLLSWNRSRLLEYGLGVRLVVVQSEFLDTLKYKLDNGFSMDSSIVMSDISYVSIDLCSGAIRHNTLPLDQSLGLSSSSSPSPTIQNDDFPAHTPLRVQIGYISPLTIVFNNHASSIYFNIDGFHSRSFTFLKPNLVHRTKSASPSDESKETSAHASSLSSSTSYSKDLKCLSDYIDDDGLANEDSIETKNTDDEQLNVVVGDHPLSSFSPSRGMSRRGVSTDIKNVSTAGFSFLLVSSDRVFDSSRPSFGQAVTIDVSCPSPISPPPPTMTMTTSSPPNKSNADVTCRHDGMDSLRVVDTQWCAWERQYIRISEDGSRAHALMQTNDSAAVLGEETRHGVQTFRFTFSSCSNLSVGVTTADLPLLSAFSEEVCMPSFACRYESCGQISCLTSSMESHLACTPISAAPRIRSKDVVTIELSLENSGFIRIFHCGTVVFVVEQLFQRIVTATALHPFATFSSPLQAVHLQRLVSLTGRDSDLRWMWKCFHSLRTYSLLTTVQEDCSSSPDNPPPVRHCHPMAIAAVEGNAPASGSRTQAVSDRSLSLSLSSSPWSQLLNAAHKLTVHQASGFSVAGGGPPGMGIISDLSAIMGLLNTIHNERDDSSSTKTLLPMSSSLFSGSPYDILFICNKLLGSMSRIPNDSIAPGFLALVSISVSLCTIPVLGAYFCHTLVHLGALERFSHYLIRHSFYENEVVEKIVVVAETALNSREYPADVYTVLKSGIISRLTWVAVKTAATDSPIRKRIISLIGQGIRRALAVCTNSHSRSLSLSLPLVRTVVENGWCKLLKKESLLPDFDKSLIFDLVELTSAYPKRFCLCFDPRVQSSHHIWVSSNSNSVDDKTGMLHPAGEPYLGYEMMEIIPEIRTSSGSNADRLLTANPAEFWQSSGIRPHWVEVIPPHPVDVGSCNVAIYIKDFDLFTPEVIAVKVGTHEADLETVKTVTLPKQEGWYTILRGDVEVPDAVSARIMRIEILRNSQNGVNCKLAGIAVYAHSGKTRAATNMCRSYVYNDSGYSPKNWRECLYLAMREGDVPVFSQLVNSFGVGCLRQELFFGDGPWKWGHPAHIGGPLGHLLPCSPLDALRRMRAVDLSSEAIESFISMNEEVENSPRCSPAEGLEMEEGYCSNDNDNFPPVDNTLLGVVNNDQADETEMGVRTDDRATDTSPVTEVPNQFPRLSLDTFRYHVEHEFAMHQHRQQQLQLLQQGTDVLSGSSSPYSLSVGQDIINMRLMEEIRLRTISNSHAELLAALFDTIDEEQNDISRSPMSPNRNVSAPLRMENHRPRDLSPMVPATNTQSTSALRQRQPNASGSESNNNGNGNDLRESLGPASAMYVRADGTYVEFDESTEACGAFGFFHGQRVQSLVFPEFGFGTIIGVHEGHLWIHFEEDEGATYRADNWQQADLVIAANTTKANSYSCGTFEDVRKQALSVGDRVSRGRDWQWSSQDVFAGNHGTVIEMSPHDQWVSVQWEGGGRNTYRWGAEGQYDLELVCGEREVSNSPETVNRNNLHMQSKVFGNQKLGDAEVITSHLRKNDCGSILVDMFRSSVARKGTVSEISRIVSNLLNLTVYDRNSQNPLQFTVEDMSCLLRIVNDRTCNCPSGIILRMRAIRLFSIFASSKNIITADSVLNAVHVEELLQTLSELSPCHDLVLASLNLMADIIHGVYRSLTSSRDTVAGRSRNAYDGCHRNKGGGSSAVLLPTEDSKEELWDEKIEDEEDHENSQFFLLRNAEGQTALALAPSPVGSWRMQNNMVYARLLSSSRQRSISEVSASSSSSTRPSHQNRNVMHLRSHDFLSPSSMGFIPGIVADVARQPYSSNVATTTDASIMTQSESDRDAQECKEHEIESRISHPIFEDKNVNLLVKMLIPILTLENYQSSSAIIVALDILNCLIKVSSTTYIFFSNRVHVVLASLVKGLLNLQKNDVTNLLFVNCLTCMLELHKASPVVSVDLLNGLLDAVSDTRDFPTIIAMMKSHPLDKSSQIKCIETLTGRCRPRVSTPSTALDWRTKLTVDDKVDARDRNQHWYEAVIKGLRSKREEDGNVSGDDNKVLVLVHYLGWGNKYDEWLPRSSERLQRLHTETVNWREELRLDDPIEVLCLHTENQDVKRRWFRGAVQKMTADKVLVVYDKRGSREERWLDVFGEEICRPGTHVPYAGGPLDLKQSYRKNDLLDYGAHNMIIECLRMFIDDESVSWTCLDALQYIITGDDKAMRLQRLLEKSCEKVICETIRGHVDCPGLVECGCFVLDALCYSVNAEVLFVGDAVEAQWRRRGNTVYPGRISRVRDDGTYDVQYDDGDREERIPRDRVSPLSSDRQDVPSIFLQTVVEAKGPETLLSALSQYRDVQAIVTPVISILAMLVEALGPTDNDLAHQFVAAGGLKEIVRVIRCAVDTRTVTIPLLRYLSVLRHLATVNTGFKEEIIEAEGHSVAVCCLQGFPTNSQILCGTLRVLAAMVATGGAMNLPVCKFSTGETPSVLDPRNMATHTFWKTTGHPVSECTPHWLEIELPPLNRFPGPLVFSTNKYDVIHILRWREVCLYLADFGHCAPEMLVLKYNEESAHELLDCPDMVKIINDLPRGGGWTSVLSTEEVQGGLIISSQEGGVRSADYLEQQLQRHQQHGAVLRIELSRNYSAGPQSKVCGVGVRMNPPVVVGASNPSPRVESWKDVIAAMDGVSLAVECAQAFHDDRELQQSCRSFLRNFATDEARRKLVKDCGVCWQHSRRLNNPLDNKCKYLNVYARQNTFEKKKTLTSFQKLAFFVKRFGLRYFWLFVLFPTCVDFSLISDCASNFSRRVFENDITLSGVVWVFIDSVRQLSPHLRFCVNK